MKSVIKITDRSPARSLLRVALNAALVLLVPLVAMQFSGRVDLECWGFCGGGCAADGHWLGI